MSIVQTLTEGIVQRDMAKEGQALLNKWSQTGLLEGLTDDHQRSSMARLLENQAKELLRESSSMALVTLKVSLLWLSQLFVVYSPDLSLTILLVFNQ